MSWLFSFWTVFVFVVFLGVVFWALRGERREEFEQAARIPLEDDDEPRVEGIGHG